MNKLFQDLKKVKIMTWATLAGWLDISSRPIVGRLLWNTISKE